MPKLLELIHGKAYPQIRRVAPLGRLSRHEIKIAFHLGRRFLFYAKFTLKKQNCAPIYLHFAGAMGYTFVIKWWKVVESGAQVHKLVRKMMQNGAFGTNVLIL